MRERPLILVVDDNQDNLDILVARLESLDYDTAVAVDGEDALNKIAELVPDLVLLDIMMPKIDGLEVCRQMRADRSLPFIPIILVTAKSSVQDVVVGLDAGADDYLTKPVDHAALIARLRSMLRVKALQDEVEEKRAELTDWNETLQQRVAEQVEEIERIGRLRRFLSPQIADLVVSQGGEERLESHRAEVTVLFADLRGFTSFAERSEPGVVMSALAAFHALAGPLINHYEGTLERFLGDGIMVLFNDPVPCPDPESRAVRLACELRAGFRQAVASPTGPEERLGLGIGIAHGMATLGRIGYEGRFDYAAIGTAANLAARLCEAAEDGQILVTDEIARSTKEIAPMITLGKRAFKGFPRQMSVHNVLNRKVSDK